MKARGWKKVLYVNSNQKRVGVKEDTCCDYWVLYASDESLNSIPEFIVC